MEREYFQFFYEVSVQILELDKDIIKQESYRTTVLRNKNPENFSKPNLTFIKDKYFQHMVLTDFLSWFSRHNLHFKQKLTL